MTTMKIDKVLVLGAGKIGSTVADMIAQYHGLPVTLADKLTARDSLRDDTRISIGSNSTLVINRFNFDSKTQAGDVDTSILRGTMRYITGLVGRRNPDSVRVATRSVTIGIRGTDFIVEVADDQ